MLITLRTYKLKLWFQELDWSFDFSFGSKLLTFDSSFWFDSFEKRLFWVSIPRILNGIYFNNSRSFPYRNSKVSKESSVQPANAKFPRSPNLKTLPADMFFGMCAKEKNQSSWKFDGSGMDHWQVSRLIIKHCRKAFSVPMINTWQLCIPRAFHHPI